MPSFFILLFGPTLLILFGFYLRDRSRSDAWWSGLPGSVRISLHGIIISIVGLPALYITSATRRELGVLRRFSVIPLRPLNYCHSDILVPFAMTLLGILLLLLVGAVVYNVSFEGNLFSLLVGISLGAFAFFALGYTLVGLVASLRAVTLIGNVVLYPLMLFSGALVPMEVMPETVQEISRYFPLTHLVVLLRGLWFGKGWGDFLTEAVVLARVGIFGMLIVARTFRWE